MKKGDTQTEVEKRDVTGPVLCCFTEQCRMQKEQQASGKQQWS
jgi:hypothetical protein